MSHRTFYLTPEGDIKRDLSEAEISKALDEEDGLLWLDIIETNAADGELLARLFNFHPLAVGDCLDPEIHVPKVDDYGDHLFIIARGIDYTVETDILSTSELNLFLGRNFVVTNHNVRLYSIESIASLVDRDGLPMRRGAVFLAYMLVDALVDNILPVMEGLSEWADAIEDAAIGGSDPQVLEEILALKRSSLRLGRAMIPQTEMLNRLSRREFSHISDEAQLYYRDVYDTLLRIEGQNEGLRERADTALSIYLSMVANRQNDLMKVLSVVATVFLPLTLLAGIYGMNFEYIPELGWRWGYFAVLGVMAAAIVIVLWVFWARNWITFGRRQLRRFNPVNIDRDRLGSYIGKLDPRHIDPVRSIRDRIR